MAKTINTNSEIASDVSSSVPKPKVFMETNSTNDNIRVYSEWKVKLLEQELADELKTKRKCCKRKRPRCRMCYEKRCYVKYDNLRRKFIALNRIKELISKLNSPIKGIAV